MRKAREVLKHCMFIFNLILLYDDWISCMKSYAANNVCFAIVYMYMLKVSSDNNLLLSLLLNETVINLILLIVLKPKICVILPTFPLFGPDFSTLTLNITAIFGFMPSSSCFKKC